MFPEHQLPLKIQFHLPSLFLRQRESEEHLCGIICNLQRSFFAFLNTTATSASQTASSDPIAPPRLVQSGSLLVGLLSLGCLPPQITLTLCPGSQSLTSFLSTSVLPFCSPSLKMRMLVILYFIR